MAVSRITQTQLLDHIDRINRLIFGLSTTLCDLAVVDKDAAEARRYVEASSEALKLARGKIENIQAVGAADSTD